MPHTNTKINTLKKRTATIGEQTVNKLLYGFTVRNSGVQYPPELLKAYLRLSKRPCETMKRVFCYCTPTLLNKKSLD